MRKLSTNPLVIAFPYNDEGPILLDFATTISAEGKLRVARAKGATLPDYWTITADGAPSNDPNTYYEGGSLLPIGGLHGGHKGYALSFMVALFGAVLAAVATPEMRDVRATSDSMLYGSTQILIDLERFGSLDLIKAQVEGIVTYMKDTPLREGYYRSPLPGRISKNATGASAAPTASTSKTQRGTVSKSSWRSTAWSKLGGQPSCIPR